MGTALHGAANLSGRAVTRVRADRPVAAQRLVTPFARALDLLAAFTPEERWLGNRDLAARTGLPASTVTRIARALAALGYLHIEPESRRYRLSASVLALGYAAIANSTVQRYARVKMREFAGQNRVHVNLGTRDRLEVIILDSCRGAQAPFSLELHIGSRVGLCSSPLGWALLAALPELERYYLMENVERRMPREWPRMRRRLAEAISQVHELGYCTSVGERDAEIGTIAAPIVVEGQAPFVLSCIGSSAQITRARIVRELGPKLLATVTEIQHAGAAA